jgi:hypothetical protein
LNDSFSISSPVVFEVPPQNQTVEAKQQYTDTNLSYSANKLTMIGGLITNEIKDYLFAKRTLIRIAYCQFSIRAAPANNCQTRLQVTRSSQQKDLIWFNHQQGVSATEQYEAYNVVWSIPLPFIMEIGDYLRFRCDGGSDGNYIIAFFEEPI